MISKNDLQLGFLFQCQLFTPLRNMSIEVRECRTMAITGRANGNHGPKQAFGKISNVQTQENGEPPFGARRGPHQFLTI